MDSSKEIIELIKKLNYASYMYYEKSTEVMSNKEYDELYDKLVKLEQSTGIVMSNSPTINVGYTVSENLEKMAHPTPMLSLDKTKEVDKLKDFLGDNVGLLSWKLDGLTIVLTYNDGVLTTALTRGNGIEGEIITNNAKTFTNIPLNIPFKNNLVLRGEAVISYSDFEKINEEISDNLNKYKNPRNLCSGSVRQLDPKVTSKRRVRFIAFTLVNADEKDFKTRKEQLEFLVKQGFEVVESEEVRKDTVELAVNSFKNQITHYDIPSDGLVLIYDDIEYGKSLGNTSKFPRDSIAFKWKDETRLTHLKYVEWSPSRTGLINPVAVFEPVELEGTIVTRASLHNISVMKELQLGENDEIEVYKANMIIPQISQNHTCSNNIKIPDKCPVCGSDTVIKSESDTETLHCINDNCPIKKIKSLELLVSRDALNIEGLSSKTLEKLIDERIIKDSEDIFKLDTYKNQIQNLEGFGEKSYNNLVSEIEKKRKTTLVRFFYGLGIPAIGLANAKLICRHFNNDLNKILSATKEELIKIDGIGDVLADEIICYFRDYENLSRINRLTSFIEFDLDTNSYDGILKDKKFVVTGSLNTYNNRKELVEQIENLGGVVNTSVSSNTDFLINNDIESNSSKNKKAKELGVKIITESDFNLMIEKE